MLVFTQKNKVFYRELVKKGWFSDSICHTQAEKTLKTQFLCRGTRPVPVFWCFLLSVARRFRIFETIFEKGSPHRGTQGPSVHAKGIIIGIN
jgi:hypothetical protein